MAHRQANELHRARTVCAQGLGAQCDLVTEQCGDLEGMAGAAEETQRRRPPRGPEIRPVATRCRREVLAEHDGPQL